MAKKIIFIIVDAMRWDYMSRNGYPRPTTPNMDRISADSFTFDRAYAAINQTDMSLTSIFSGYYPLTHGLEQTAAAFQINQLNNLNVWRIKYLPMMLQQAGYRTYSLDWLDRWHRWGYDWQFGSDKKKVGSRLRQLGSRFPRLSRYLVRQIMRRWGAQAAFRWPRNTAESTTDLALGILQENIDDNLFLMIHYWDVHAPYLEKNYDKNTLLNDMQQISLPGEDQDLQECVDQLCRPDAYKDWARNDVINDLQTTGDLIARYCASLRAVDIQIGRINQYLKQNNLLDETVFIITADHGENLFENGYFIEHSGVRENVMHIPLMMRLPGYEAGRSEEVVSHVDIVPTLTDYLELSTDAQFDGLSLIPLLRGQQLLARDTIYFQSRLEQHQWGIIADSRFKYTEVRQVPIPPCRFCGQQHLQSPELFDLVEDNLERNDLVEKCPDLTEELGLRLHRLVTDLNDKSASISDGRSDSQAKYSAEEQADLDKRLRSLGYIE